MSLFGEEEDVRKINSLYFFFNIESQQDSFFIIFEKLCNAGLNLQTKVFTLSTIPKMRNPPLPKKSTFPPNKHFSHKKHTFFGVTKMCLLWAGTVFYLQIIFCLWEFICSLLIFPCWIIRRIDFFEWRRPFFFSNSVKILKISFWNSRLCLLLNSSSRLCHRFLLMKIAYRLQSLDLKNFV